MDTLDVVFPPWLPTLRSVGYRLEALPQPCRGRIQAALRRREIELRPWRDVNMAVITKDGVTMRQITDLSSTAAGPNTLPSAITWTKGVYS
jgi:hypothetical protein